MSAALLAVLALIVAIVFAAGGSDGSSGTQAAPGRAPATAPASAPASGNEPALLATRAARLPSVGSGWTPLGAHSFGGPKADESYPCVAPDSMPRAVGGGDAEYTYELGPDNIEHGHLEITVRAMASPAAARTRAALQSDPRYSGCLPAFDDEVLAGSALTDVVHHPIERLVGDGGVGAARYRDVADGQFHGRLETGSELLRGYFSVGRYNATVIVSGTVGFPEFDAVLDEVLTSLAARLAVIPSNASAETSS